MPSSIREPGDITTTRDRSLPSSRESSPKIPRRALTHDSDDDDNCNTTPGASTAAPAPAQGAGDATTGSFILRQAIVPAWGPATTPTAKNTYIEPPITAKQFLPGQSTSTEPLAPTPSEKTAAPPRKKRSRKDKSTTQVDTPWRVQGYTYDPDAAQRLSAQVAATGPYSSAFRASASPPEVVTENMAPAPSSIPHTPRIDVPPQMTRSRYPTSTYPAPITYPTASTSYPSSSSSVQSHLRQPEPSQVRANPVESGRAYTSQDIYPPQRRETPLHNNNVRVGDHYHRSSSGRYVENSHPEIQPHQTVFHSRVSPENSYKYNEGSHAIANTTRPDHQPTRAPPPSASSGHKMAAPPTNIVPWELQPSELRLIAILIEDKRYKDPQIAEFEVPVKSFAGGAFWADAKEVCDLLQRSPGRIDGPAKVYQWRDKYRHIFLRVSADNRDHYRSTSLFVSADRTLTMIVELDTAPTAPAMIMASLPRIAVIGDRPPSPAGSSNFNHHLPTPGPSEKTEVSTNGSAPAIRRTASHTSISPGVIEDYSTATPASAQNAALHECRSHEQTMQRGSESGSQPATEQQPPRKKLRQAADEEFVSSLTRAPTESEVAETNS